MEEGRFRIGLVAEFARKRVTWSSSEDAPEYLGKRGRELLGIMRGATCRRDYGAEFMKITGQRVCAYCGLDLVFRFDSWLTMVLDHVVPVSVCKAMQVPNKWRHDYSNAVLSCSACNGFCNRYSPTMDGRTCSTLEQFYDLRDEIFPIRKQLIEVRRMAEFGYFEASFANRTIDYEI
jgi:hypothetical protein